MRLVIPHSTYVMMPAAMIYKTASLSVKSVPGITGKFSPFEIKDVTVDPIYINTSKEANIRDSLENISEFAPLTKTTPDYTVLYGDEWTRQNTLKDIRYFARKLKTLTPSEPLYARIQAESGATIPPILQTAFAEKLCNGIGGSGTHSYRTRQNIVENHHCVPFSIIRM
jgi:hypothetical protein